MTTSKPVRPSAGPTLILSLMTLLLLLMAAGSAVAQPMQVWKRDLDWSEQARRLEVSADARGFVFESLPQAAGDELLVGRFDVRDAEFHLQLRNASGDGTPQGMRVVFTNVIEYRDTDLDGRYTASDAALREWRPQDVRVPKVDAQAGRDGSHRITASYPMGAALDVDSRGDNLTARLQFHLTQSLQTINGVAVVPTEVKFDVELVGHRYNTTDSRLAAGFRVLSDAPSSLGADVVETGSGEFRFAFGWRTSAFVDGYMRPVGVTAVPISDTTSAVYFAYARGSQIKHDPTVGVHHYEATVLQPLAQMLTRGHVGLYLAGLVGASALVAAFTYVRARSQ